MAKWLEQIGWFTDRGTHSEGVSTGQFGIICSQNYNNDKGTERKI